MTISPHKDKANRAEENLKAILKENPVLAQAFRETLEDLRSPENIAKMSRDIGLGIQILNKLRQGGNVNDSK